MKFKVIGIFIFLLLLGANPVQAQQTGGDSGSGECFPPNPCSGGLPASTQMLLMVEEAKAKLKLEKTNRDKVKTEAIQTAAMAIRLVMSLDRYEYKPLSQHEQMALANEKQKTDGAV